jgi:hypothetical protein
MNNEVADIQSVGLVIFGIVFLIVLVAKFYILKD